MIKVNCHAANKGFCASWADGISLNICISIWLQFQLDRTLLSKSTKHQLKPINLADVYKQTELEIPNLHKALNVSGKWADKTRMRKISFILTILVLLTSCENGSTNSTQTIPSDNSTRITSDTVPKQTTPSTPTKTLAEIPETHLHDTTVVSGSFILFLRPDSLRFESYTLDDHSGIYETDSDFGFGIAGTMDNLTKHKKYKNIQALVSENRYIIIKDCKNGPVTIDRDSVDYGIILSGKGRQIKTTYDFVHSGNYLQEIEEYFRSN